MLSGRHVRSHGMGKTDRKDEDERRKAEAGKESAGAGARDPITHSQETRRDTTCEERKRGRDRDT